MKSTRAPRRTFHIIDIENLCGSPLCSTAACRLMHNAYRSAVGLGEHDLYLLGADQGNGAAVFGWPTGSHRVFGKGKDGADRALLEAAMNYNLPAQVDHVVIGSGDHFFADAARMWRTQGLTVTVVGLSGNISYALYSATPNVIELSHKHVCQPLTQVEVSLAG